MKGEEVWDGGEKKTRYNHSGWKVEGVTVDSYEKWMGGKGNKSYIGRRLLSEATWMYII